MLKCFYVGNNKLPEDRVRYWNAYLLFYELIVPTRGSVPRRSSRIRLLRKSAGSPSNRTDSLSELSELIQQTDGQVRK